MTQLHTILFNDYLSSFDTVCKKKQKTKICSLQSQVSLRSVPLLNVQFLFLKNFGTFIFFFDYFLNDPPFFPIFWLFLTNFWKCLTFDHFYYLTFMIIFFFYYNQSNLVGVFLPYTTVAILALDLIHMTPELVDL